MTALENSKAIRGKKKQKTEQVKKDGRKKIYTKVSYQFDVHDIFFKLEFLYQ